MMIEDTTVPRVDYLDSEALTDASYAKAQERLIKDFDYGASDGGQAVAKAYHSQLRAALDELLDTGASGKGFRGYYELLAQLQRFDRDELAMVILQSGVSAVASGRKLTGTLMMLGRALEHEVYARLLRGYDSVLAARLEDQAKKRAGSYKARRSAVRSMAKRKGFSTKAWTDTNRIHAGKLMVDLLLTTDAFVFVVPTGDTSTHGYLVMTEEAMAKAEAFIDYMVQQHPIMTPTVVEPRPWEDLRNTFDLGRTTRTYSLIRRDCKVMASYLREAHAAGDMRQTYEALNVIQETPWTINRPILDLVSWAYHSGLKVKGLPPKADVIPPMPLSEADWDGLDEEHRKFQRSKIAEVHQLNRGYRGQRLRLLSDLATAEALAGYERFWTPCNLDYRGRVYPITQFNFQRQDAIRAMFTFAGPGEVLTEEGLYWLKVHVANCGDFEKVSKKSFDERVRWVDENSDLLMRVGLGPERNLEWTEADKPFMFVAAARALNDAYYGFSVNLPVSFDGTCSGLQHLAAMTRCEATAPLVNLRPSYSPSDVYGTVADEALIRVYSDTEDQEDLEKAKIAKVCLDNGITRGLVKRNVMTYSYSSKRFGMQQQLIEDTMVPLAEKVLAGELEYHPYGEDNGRKAAKYLSGVTYAAIESVVSRPADAMKYLQTIAKALAHEGKPVVWTTPLGLPVVMRYPNTQYRVVNLWLHDRGLRLPVNPSLTTEASGIDKGKSAQVVAPSFVHSMDACHLMGTVLGAKDAGITSVALVHDSFGCHPNRAGEFRSIIRSWFHWVHNHDILGSILLDSRAQMQSNYHRLPKALDRGSYDLKEVLDAEYAFA